jgi:hypothetical protein
MTVLQLAWDALQDVTLYALLASGFFSVLAGKFLGGEAAQSGTLEGLAILGSVVVVVLVTAVNDYQKESQFQELNTVKDDVQVRKTRDGFPPSHLNSFLHSVPPSCFPFVMFILPSSSFPSPSQSSSIFSSSSPSPQS